MEAWKLDLTLVLKLEQNSYPWENKIYVSISYPCPILAPFATSHGFTKQNTI
jgi:hypothetical protein